MSFKNFISKGIRIRNRNGEYIDPFKSLEIDKFEYEVGGMSTTIESRDGSPLIKRTILNPDLLDMIDDESQRHVRFWGSRQCGSTTYALLYALYCNKRSMSVAYVCFDNSNKDFTTNALRNIVDASNLPWPRENRKEQFGNIRFFALRADGRDDHASSLKRYDVVIFDNAIYNNISASQLFRLHEKPKNLPRIIEILTG